MATTADIYEPRASVKERFPEMEDGLELVEAIFDLYSISRSGELQFYDSSMRNKLVIPHELNSRDQHQVLRKYVASVKKYGVIQGVRGEPWCVLSDGNKPPWRMLSWGTLSRAVYAAYEEDETNPKVLKSITTGLRNAVVLHCRTPSDCLVYLRDFHNRWHGGSSMTFTDTIAETVNLDKAWLGYAKSKGWQVRSCGSGQNSWAARQWAFISSQSPEKYSSANVYLHAKALATWLSKSGLMQDLRSYCGSCVFFDEPRLSNSNVIHLLHSWGLILQQYRQIDNSSKRLLFLEGLAFMMPCTAMEPHPEMTCSGREVPWLFQTVDMDLMKLVHTPMATSQIYTRAANGGNGKGNGKNKRKAIESETPAGDEEGECEGDNRSQKKGKGKGGGKSTRKKGSPKGKNQGNGAGHEEKSERTAAWQSILGSTTNLTPSQNESEGSAGMPVLEATEDSDMPPSDALNPDAAFVAKVFAGPEDGSARQVLWLDDMVSSCLRVVDFEFGKDECGAHRLPKGLSEAMVSRVISFFFSSSLEFAWKKSLTLSGKTMRQWTQVRPALQELIRNAFIEMKTGTATPASAEGGCSSVSAAAMVLGTNTSQAIVSRLLNACKQDETEKAQASEVKECPAAKEEAENSKLKSSQAQVPAEKSADRAAEAEATHKSLKQVLGFVPSDASMLSQIALGNLDAFPVGSTHDFDVTTIALPDHVPFDFVAIREIMTELQAALFRWAYSHESRKHMEDIFVDISKPSPSILCKFPCELTKDKDFRLPLAGTVSLTPSNSSLPLCVVSKQTSPADASTDGPAWDAEEEPELKVVIYVTGDSHKCICGDQFVPAWSVKSVSKDPFLAVGPVHLHVRKPESWMKNQNGEKEQTPQKDKKTQPAAVGVTVISDSPEKTDGQVAKVAQQVHHVDDDAEDTLSIQAPCLMPTHPLGALKQAGDNIPFAELTRGSFREGTGSSAHIRQLGKVMDKLGFGALRATLIKSEADDGQQLGPAQSKAAKKALKNADHLLR